MSGTLIVRTLLVADAPLLAVPVSATWIRAGVDLPLKTESPAILVLGVGSVPFNRIKAGATQIHSERVQVYVLSRDYEQIKTILRLVRAAVLDTHGTVAGFNVIDITLDVESPELRDEPTGLMAQSRDFIVRWTG